MTISGLPFWQPAPLLLAPGRLAGIMLGVKRNVGGGPASPVILLLGLRRVWCSFRRGLLTLGESSASNSGPPLHSHCRRYGGHPELGLCRHQRPPLADCGWREGSRSVCLAATACSSVFNSHANCPSPITDLLATLAAFGPMSFPASPSRRTAMNEIIPRLFKPNMAWWPSSRLGGI